MADKKISQLTAASTPLAGTEVLPIVQSSSTVKVAVSDLTAGRTVSMTSATLTSAINIQTSASNRWIIQKDGTGQDLLVYRYNDSGGYAGNPLRIDRSNGVITWENGLAQGTAATGVNFSANTPAAGMTSQLLNWYEEGTWTPVITTSNADATVSSYTSQKGFYIRMGSQVFCSIQLRANLSSAGTGNPRITGLPYSVLTDSNAAPSIIYWDLFGTKAGYTAYCPFGIAAGGASVVDFPGFVWATGVNNYLYFTLVYRT